MKIIVNGIEWELIFTSDLSKLERDDGSVTLGVTDTNSYIVYIWNRLNSKMTRKVLLHELCHVFIHSYGYVLDIEQEEFLCSFLDTHSDEIIELCMNVLSGYEKKFSKF